MSNELFVIAVAALLGCAFFWGFRNLPAERWQIMAAVPLRKDQAGGWHGLNLTYYGFFNATACAFACAIVLILMSSIHTSRVAVLVIVGSLIVVTLPASRIVARLVEGKRHTFTISGASFVGIVLLPALIKGFNLTLGEEFGLSVPLLPMLAAGAVAYAFGEALGRLACISFGCCYGKAITRWPRGLESRASRFCFVFTGETKKVSYEGKLSDTPVIPIQAITSIIFAVAALAGTLLFLKSYWSAALLVPLLTTQSWRVLSEIFRADYRGGRRVSPYQLMSLLAIVYVLSAVPFLGQSDIPEPNVVAALGAFSSGWLVIVIEILWLIVFLYLGRSSVTRSRLSFEVARERI